MLVLLLLLLLEIASFAHFDALFKTC